MEIETSARLHLSLIDLNGLEGRLDGGIGVTLQEPTLNIECKESTEDTTIIFDKKLSDYHFDTYETKIIDATNKMNKYLNIDNNYEFNIKKLYPIHQGLGLGTQISLSVAKLISELNEHTLSTIELAKIIQRGGTSGIGVYSFDMGGLIIDGGHKKSLKKDYLPSSASKVSPPPLIAHYDFPEEWNIILVTPQSTKGASGKKEIDIFQTYSPIDIQNVQQISYLTLMKLMPAIVEKDLQNFGDAINKIQRLGFKKIERDLQDSTIHEIMEHMELLNIPAVGMSSFGPTCFGITDENPKLLQKELKELTDNTAEIRVTKGKNHGSILKK
ncbi:MAG: hypothetical protein IJI98_06900 [Methanosphaera sp.]|nr:hypothetical protein [Methanosphaera sp.]